MSFFSCLHPRTTPADEDGKSVCADCGTVISTGPLNLTEFDRTRAQLEVAPHTLACVHLGHEWFCPPDCPAPR